MAIGEESLIQEFDEDRLMAEHSPDPVDPRANLAHDRRDLASLQTQLALDRTMLAWIGTTLGMASFGFGMVAFFRTLEEKASSPATIRMHHGAIRMGTALLLLGIASTVLAGISHWFTLRRLRRGEPLVLSHWPLSITVAMLSTVIGLAGLWELFVR
jgi:putative membrane protein